MLMVFMVILRYAVARMAAPFLAQPGQVFVRGSWLDVVDGVGMTLKNRCSHRTRLRCVKKVGQVRVEVEEGSG
jgi:hypothetical protein